MMHVPKLSLESAEKFISLVVASFLADVGVDDVAELSDLPMVMPSANKLKHVMVEETVDTITIDKMDMDGKPLFLMCDKGDSSNRRDGASFVKLIARWNSEKDKVRVTSIGIEGAGNTTEDGADAIDHSLKFFETPTRPLQLNGQGTDAGGGATRVDLKNKLNTRGRITNYDDYFDTTCALHGLNLTLSSPTVLVMGEGGMYKRTALQLLHTAYNLTQQYRGKEWKMLWELCTKTTCVSIKCPVLSRWECVSDCVEHILNNKKDWLTMCTYISHAEPSNSAKNTIASYLYSYLNEPMLIVHLHFLNGYTNAWWRKHFEWQKSIDDKSGMPGFRGRHMAVRYFIQHISLKDLKDSSSL